MIASSASNLTLNLNTVIMGRLMLAAVLLAVAVVACSARPTARENQADMQQGKAAANIQKALSLLQQSVVAQGRPEEVKAAALWPSIEGGLDFYLWKDLNRN